MNKKIWITIGIIILVTIGWFFYSASKKQYCWPYCPEMTNEDREEIKESALDSSIKDWGTYEDDSFGFSFKYPKEIGEPERVNLDSTVKTVFFEKQDGVHLALYSGIYYQDKLHNKSPRSFEELMSDNDVKTPINISGKEAIRLDYSQDGSYVFIKLDNSGNILEISGSAYYIDKILPTFKFTK